MLTYQFSAKMTNKGELSVPAKYLESIPSGSKVQVILLVEPPTPSSNQNREAESIDNIPSLEEYVEYLRSRPLPKELITPASGLLGTHLANSSEPIDPDFDEAVWNHEWDQLEAAMDADELVDEQNRLQRILQDLQR